jgi:hypothetical protein
VDPSRRYRAGDALDDVCRACKALREHLVLAVDGEGRLLKVQCGFCGSQHLYRGGERAATPARPPSERRPTGGGDGIVSERERRYPEMSVTTPDGQPVDLEMMLRRILREEGGATAVSMAERWRGGELALRPFRKELQEKVIPIETFFNKIVMLRNRLRTLEQHVNASDLPAEAKLKLQGYVTGCYGSLTTFNVLFADDDDRFVGAGGQE